MESDEARAIRLLEELWSRNGQQGAEAAGVRAGQLTELTAAVEAIIARMIASREREVRALAALRPFARYSKALGSNRASQTCNGVTIDEGDMRRAAEALGH